MSTWLLLQKVHGHLGVLAVALALHPVVSLRRGTRPSARSRLSGYTAAALMLLANAAGWLVYPAYREEVKGRLFEVSVTYGRLFETKEHLAFYALCLALSGAVLMWAGDVKHGAALRRPARITWALCFVCALAAGALGVVTASAAGFR